MQKSRVRELGRGNKSRFYPHPLAPPKSTTPRARRPWWPGTPCRATTRSGGPATRATWRPRALKGQGPTGTGRCNWLPVSEGPHRPGAGGPGQGGASGRGSWERETDGDRGRWATLSRRRGPSRPLGGCTVGARGAGFTDRVSHQPCAPAQFGGSAVRSQEAPRGVRKEILEGCSPPLTSPAPLPFLVPGGK